MKHSTDYVIGHTLAAVRRSQNLSQETVARRMALTQTQVSLIEAGKRSLKMRELPLFAKAVNVPYRQVVALICRTVSLV